MRKYRYLFLLISAFAANSMCATHCFAYNLHSHVSSCVIHELKPGRYNNELLVNGNNPLQLVNYRTPQSGQFVKILLIGIFSLLVSLKYLKYNLKNINSEYARFLKLLLFPNHVFW